MKYDEKINKFLEELKRQGIEKIVAFSGSLPNIEDPELKEEIEERARTIVEESFQVFKGLPIALQIGGTKWDIQVYSAEEARKLQIPIMGIYPQAGSKHAMKDLDFALEVVQSMVEAIGEMKQKYMQKFLMPWKLLVVVWEVQ